MTKYIDKSAVVAEIENRLKANGAFDEMGDAAWWEDKGMRDAYRSILSFIDTLKVKEVDLKLIVGWFDHIAQIANDRKTLNGKIMEDWAALDEIKCLARNSSEFIKKYYRVQNNKVYENNN